MSLAEELAYLRQKVPDLLRDPLEAAIECRLAGGGFDSWEGVALLTRRGMVLSSAPGVFSPGRFLSLPFEGIALSQLRRESLVLKRRATGESGGGGGELVLQPFEKSSSGAWAEWVLRLLLRLAGCPAPGEPWPDAAFPPSDRAVAAAGEEILEPLHRLFPGHREIIFWRAACLLACDRPGKAADLLRELGHVEGSDQPVLGLLLAQSLALDGEWEALRALARQGFGGRPPAALRRLETLAAAALAAMPEDAPPADPGRNPRGLVFRYGARRTCQPKSWSALQETVDGPLAHAVAGWEAVARGDWEQAEQFLSTYRRQGNSRPLEILRLECALHEGRGEPELAFHLLSNARDPSLLEPLFDLAGRLGKESELTPALTGLDLRGGGIEVLVQMAEVRRRRREWPEVEALLTIIGERRDILGPLPRARLHLLAGEAALGQGRLADIPAALSLAIRALGGKPGTGSSSGMYQGMTSAVGPWLLTPGFPDLLGRLAVLGCAMTSRQDDDGAFSGWWGVAQGFPQAAGAPEPGLPHEDSPRTDLASPSPHRRGEGAGGALHRVRGAPADPSHPVLADLSASLSRLGDRLGDAGDRVGLPALAHLARQARELAGETGLSSLVAVVGEFNAGKSSLLNALFQTRLLPVGICPTTCLPCVIRAGDREEAVALDDLGGLHSLPTRDLGPYLDERARDASSAGGAGLPALGRLEVFLPHPLLGLGRVVDMPGLNSRFSRHQSLTENFVHRADVVLWVANATQMGSASEHSAWQRLLVPGQRVIFVLNRWDEIDPAERPIVEDAFRQMVAPMSRDVFFLSAARSVSGRPEDAPFAADLGAFATCLEKVLREQAATGRMEFLRRRAAGLATEGIARLQKWLAGYRSVPEAGLQQARQLVETAADAPPLTVDRCLDRDWRKEFQARRRRSGEILLGQETFREALLGEFRKRWQDQLIELADAFAVGWFRSLETTIEAVSQAWAGLAGHAADTLVNNWQGYLNGCLTGDPFGGRGGWTIRPEGLAGFRRVVLSLAATLGDDPDGEEGETALVDGLAACLEREGASRTRTILEFLRVGQTRLESAWAAVGRRLALQVRTPLEEESAHLQGLLHAWGMAAPGSPAGPVALRPKIRA